MKKNTLTIGIPAYNEEANIQKLLESIFCQRIRNVDLKSIILVCDGCTDKTVEILKFLNTKYKILDIITSNIRSGKAVALNKIYAKSQSDFLLTMDADVIFDGINNIELMADKLIKNPKLNMVGPDHIPTKTKTLFGNFSRISGITIREAVAKFNNGNNFYSCMAAEFMRKRFYKSFIFPHETLSDQCYVYGKSIEHGLFGYEFVPEAKVIFGVAQTFHDWRISSIRSTIGDKADAIKHFGNKILPLYTIPKTLYFLTLLKWFLKSPIYSTGSIIMNIYIRLFPYHKPERDSVWEVVKSSKYISV